LASDYNPGTCPTGNIPFIIALACTQMKLLPEEAIIASTINAAKALELSDTHGKIAVGKPAHLIITEKMDSFYELPYFFATPKIAHTFINGRIFTS
jgi:imidazolonepropionase